jgi:hypothetical protein
MSRSQLIGLARRVKGISETEEPGDPPGSVEFVGYHARDTSAHRFTADDEPAIGREGIDRREIFGNEFLCTRGRLAAFSSATAGHIVKLEPSDAKA